MRTLEYAVMAVIAAVLLCSAAVGAPTTTVIASPTEVKNGDVVAITVTMVGNTSAPARTVHLEPKVTYWEEGGTQPILAPAVSYDVTWASVSAALIKNPGWTLDLPPTWLMSQPPTVDGFMGGSCVRTATGLTFSATALPPDKPATVKVYLKVG